MDDDVVVLVALADFDPAMESELPLGEGELVTLQAPAVDGWVKVCPVPNSTWADPERNSGFVPETYVSEAKPDGVMLKKFMGVGEGEISLARTGERVWRLAQQDANGWSICLLSSGLFGYVPETYVAWTESSPFQREVASPGAILPGPKSSAKVPLPQTVQRLSPHLEQGTSHLFSSFSHVPAGTVSFETNGVVPEAATTVFKAPLPPIRGASDSDAGLRFTVGEQVRSEAEAVAAAAAAAARGAALAQAAATAHLAEAEASRSATATIAARRADAAVAVREAAATARAEVLAQQQPGAAAARGREHPSPSSTTRSTAAMAESAVIAAAKAEASRARAEAEAAKRSHIDRSRQRAHVAEMAALEVLEERAKAVEAEAGERRVAEAKASTSLVAENEVRVAKAEAELAAARAELSAHTGRLRRETEARAEAEARAHAFEVDAGWAEAGAAAAEAAAAEAALLKLAALARAETAKSLMEAQARAASIAEAEAALAEQLAREEQFEQRRRLPPPGPSHELRQRQDIHIDSGFQGWCAQPEGYGQSYAIQKQQRWVHQETHDDQKEEAEMHNGEMPPETSSDVMETAARTTIAARVQEAAQAAKAARHAAHSAQAEADSATAALAQAEAELKLSQQKKSSKVWMPFGGSNSASKTADMEAMAKRAARAVQEARVAARTAHAQAEAAEAVEAEVKAEAEAQAKVAAATVAAVKAASSTMGAHPSSVDAPHSSEPDLPRTLSEAELSLRAHERREHERRLWEAEEYARRAAERAAFDEVERQRREGEMLAFEEMLTAVAHKALSPSRRQYAPSRAIARSSSGPSKPSGSSSREEFFSGKKKHEPAWY